MKKLLLLVGISVLISFQQNPLPPIEKAKALGLPLYCGEFGIIKGPPESDRLNWYKDMIQLFDEQDIGYANWNYKSGSFGLVENDGQSNEALIGIVIP